MRSALKRWTLLLGFVLGAAQSLAAAPVRSQVPWDFKGVPVGDKLSREQLMQQFGINLERPSATICYRTIFVTPWRSKSTKPSE